jgi:hypothetical protein
MLGGGEAPSDSRNCSQVIPELGITATPVIDRHVGSQGTLFVVAMSKDAAAPITSGFMFENFLSIKKFSSRART